jgi:hypothetical protein
MTITANRLTYIAFAVVVTGYSLALLAQIATQIAA